MASRVQLIDPFDLQSYRYFPAYIPTIERLAAHHIENQAYEKAIQYLEKAACVQWVFTILFEKRNN